MELCFRSELFSDYQPLRTNSGRAAIVSAITDCKPDRIWVPHYICTSVYDAIEYTGTKTCKYFIGEDFLPRDIELRPNDGVLLVNYFGICQELLSKLLDQYSDNPVIVDNTHALFSKPFENAYNIYSPRKFIGVSDGGYLVYPGRVFEPLRKSYSYGYSQHLLKSIECGTNKAYKLYKENEMRLNGNYDGMSDLTRRILSSIDYEMIKTIRNSNFEIVSNHYIERNQFPMSFSSCYAYFYPFYMEGIRNRNVKQKLIEKGFYATTLWEQHLEHYYNGTFERRLAEDLLLIPIDQRYTCEEISQLCKLIDSTI